MTITGEIWVPLDTWANPGSRSHVRRHSGVCMIWFAWQHQSPSGLEVLHLELELKR